MSGPSREAAQKPADQASGPPAGAAAADPTMEDILASIRRILNEEGTADQPAERREEVLVLDDSMMVGDPKPAAALVAREPLVGPPPGAAPQAGHEEQVLPPDQPGGARLVAPEAAAAAAAAVGGLVKRLASERRTGVYHGGPTIEDLVREELRPLLKSWLDANLPALVERVVRAEIERVLGRTAG